MRARAKREQHANGMHLTATESLHLDQPRVPATVSFCPGLSVPKINSTSSVATGHAWCIVEMLLGNAPAPCHCATTQSDKANVFSPPQNPFLLTRFVVCRHKLPKHISQFPSRFWFRFTGSLASPPHRPTRDRLLQKPLQHTFRHISPPGAGCEE